MYRFGVNQRAFRALLLGIAVAAGCRSAALPPPEEGLVAAAPAGEAPPPPPAERPARITVQQAVEEALDANRSVLSAREAVAIAETLVIEARAAMLPNLSATGSWSWREEPPQVSDPTLPTPITVGPKEVLGIDASLSMPLFAFGEYFYAWKAARLGRGVAEAERETTESDIAEAVTAAAFDYLEAVAQIETARSNEASLARQVADAQAIFDAGRVTRDAVLEAEVELARARRQREKLESYVPIRRILLNGLLGRPTDAPTELVDAPVTTEPAPLPADVEADALARRGEIRAAQLDYEAADKYVRSAWGAALPEIRGKLGYHADDNDFSNPNNYGTALLTLELPIFRGGADAARIRRAEREREQARLRREDAITLVRTELATAIREVKETWLDIAVNQQSVGKAEESLRIQREKFNAGRATSRDVLDSSSLLTRTKFDYVRSVYSYNVAMERLRRARGLSPLPAAK